MKSRPFMKISSLSWNLNFSWNIDFFMKSQLLHENLNFFIKSPLSHEISTFSWNIEFFMKSQLFHVISTLSRSLDFFKKSRLFHEISTFSWNLDFLMKCQLFLEYRYFLKTKIISLIASTLDPGRSKDSESSILDTCRSTDSEFVILGPGRARAQNSSESQNFGVIKNLCAKRDLSRTHGQTPRIHFWIP